MSEELKPLLHRMGELIRRHGVKSWKKHGNYWSLDLIKDIYLYHDDYNNSVWLKSENNILVYYGIDWGGFETKATRHDFEKMINILNTLDYFVNQSMEPENIEA